MQNAYNLKMINEQKIISDWAPTLTQAGVTESYRTAWMAKMCHFHSLTEAAAYQNQTNTTGIGSVTPAPAPNGIFGFFNNSFGSADRYPNLLPLAIQIANKTIAFDLVSVVPMQTPAGQVAYADFLYADGTLDGQQRPTMIRVNVPGTFVVGTKYFATNDDDDTVVTGDYFIQLIFIGRSTITGDPIFQVVPGKTFQATVSAGPVTSFASVPDTAVTIADIFNGNPSVGTNIVASAVTNTPTVTGATLTEISTSPIYTKASLVRAVEDHIQGYTGSGYSNTDPYQGPFTDKGTRISSGMARGVSEKTYPQMMGLEVTTRFVETYERQVGAAVTRQQMFDLQRVQGLDVVTMLESLLGDQVTQAISKELLEQLWALGWTSTKQVEYGQGGFTLNCTLDPALTAATTQTYVGKDGTLVTCSVPGFVSYGSFENMQTLQRRLATKIITAGNLITQRNRNRGGATFIVTNSILASILQDQSQFNTAPMQNNINQAAGSLYSMGSVAGMTIYVDPNMEPSDTRILVGRKGSDIEPGLKFMPYSMAESVSIIAEATMAPKVILSSRYAVVPFGQYPEVQYYTIHVRMGANYLV
jgi:hypothetical protein